MLCVRYDVVGMIDVEYVDVVVIGVVVSGVVDVVVVVVFVVLLFDVVEHVDCDVDDNVVVNPCCD